jgi:uncharacterized protein
VSMTSFTDAVKQSTQGVILSLHVVPGSSQTLFPAGYNPWRKCIEIKVKAAAKDNKANEEVVVTVAGFFQISPKDVILVSGEKSREKTVVLKKTSVSAVCQKLEGLLHG